MLKKGSRKSMNRTPLGDISNGGRISNDAKKKIQLDRDYDGGYLDRLLLVRSKLSALVNQIDEIFAQSSEQDLKSKTSNEDIESLSNLLSEMHSSLQPWVLRLSQSQTTSKTEVQEKNKSIQKNHASTHGERRNILPGMKDEDPKLDMIISPSPLVAWRAGGCKLVTEKQLFLLTPLSKKELSQCSGSFKIKARNLYMKDTNDTSQTITRNSDTISETVKEFDCIVEENSTGKTRLKKQSEAHQKKKSNARKDADEGALEWFLSPPKTCTLMDPNLPSAMEDKSLSSRNPMIAAAMDSVGVSALRADSNMPECFQESKKPDDHQLQELQLCNFRCKDDFDETLEWFLSPPKTCTLMEPLKETISLTPVTVDGSVLRSRRAGETTLKKELWTKFQAVSMGRISYKDSVLQKGEKKGFMDMLEEAT